MEFGDFRGFGPSGLGGGGGDDGGDGRVVVVGKLFWAVAVKWGLVEDTWHTMMRVMKSI